MRQTACGTCSLNFKSSIDDERCPSSVPDGRTVGTRELEMLSLKLLFMDILFP
jgi:hypothetical protein